MIKCVIMNDCMAMNGTNCKVHLGCPCCVFCSPCLRVPQALSYSFTREVCEVAPRGPVKQTPVECQPVHCPSFCLSWWPVCVIGCGGQGDMQATACDTANHIPPPPGLSASFLQYSVTSRPPLLTLINKRGYLQTSRLHLETDAIVHALTTTVSSLGKWAQWYVQSRVM